MGDEKQYTIQVKGTAYRFRPVSDDDLARVQIIFNMNASSHKMIKAITAILRDSLGTEQWDELTDRLISKDLDLSDIVVVPLKKLIEKQLKDRAPQSGDDE